MSVFKTGLALSALLMLGLSGLPAQAKQPANWYDWYRNLHGYLSSEGGVLCSPGTELQFHTDGKITAVSRDAACVASLAGLSYPLPENTSVSQLSLPIRKYSGWPLSSRALQQLVSHQISASQSDKSP
ncbi:hypothetical protein [Vampirovibrio sp.]|uniref:hypothetical protein n=1 Tax=Vampirovibrio sp. TaxID=2717857 RepID=UPI0035944846